VQPDPMELEVESLAGTASGKDDPDGLTQRNCHRGRTWQTRVLPNVSATLNAK
jgi:hypothetical protein